MENHLDATIKELHAKLEKQMEDVIDTKKAINLLRKHKGDPPLFTDSDLSKLPNNIRPDQYYGKPLSKAAREYLEYRKKACTASDILKGLQEGGFDFNSLGWSENGRLRNMSISLAKNSSMFHRLPNNTYGLLVWYPDVKKPKTKSEKNNETSATQEELKENGGEKKKQTPVEKDREMNTESDQ